MRLKQSVNGRLCFNIKLKFLNLDFELSDRELIFNYNFLLGNVCNISLIFLAAREISLSNGGRRETSRAVER